MKQFQYAAIKERQKPFKPSEIHFLGLGVTHFNPPLLRPCDKIVADEFEQISLLAAGVEYDMDTYTGEKKEKKAQEKEFEESKNKGEKTEDFKAHSKPFCEAYKAKREKEKKSIVEKRALEPEFKTKISDALNECKNVQDLPACVDDIKSKLDFAIEKLGVKPENVILLVTEDLFNLCVKHIPLKGKDKKAGL